MNGWGTGGGRGAVTPRSMRPQWVGTDRGLADPETWVLSSPEPCVCPGPQAGPSPQSYGLVSRLPASPRPSSGQAHAASGPGGWASGVHKGQPLEAGAGSDTAPRSRPGLAASLHRRRETEDFQGPGWRRPLPPERHPIQSQPLFTGSGGDAPATVAPPGVTQTRGWGTGGPFPPQTWPVGRPQPLQERRLGVQVGGVVGVQVPLGLVPLPGGAERPPCAPVCRVGLVPPPPRTPPSVCLRGLHPETGLVPSLG